MDKRFLVLIGILFMFSLTFISAGEVALPETPGILWEDSDAAAYPEGIYPYVGHQYPTVEQWQAVFNSGFSSAVSRLNLNANGVYVTSYSQGGFDNYYGQCLNLLGQTNNYFFKTCSQSPRNLQRVRFLKCEQENIKSCVDSKTISYCSSGSVKNISCSAGELCSDGACVCEENKKVCKDSRNYKSCANNNWNILSCPSGTECSEGECVTTCVALGGDVCGENQYCGSFAMTASDSDKCCAPTILGTQCPYGVCSPIKESNCFNVGQIKTCSQCGDGLFNVCDVSECQNSLNEWCVFNSGFLGNIFGGSCSNVKSENIEDGKQICKNGECRNVVNVLSCQELNDGSAYYILKNDIEGIMGSCFDITNNNIILDMNGKKIVGNINGQDFGIHAVGVNNLFVKNGIIESFYYSGIYLENVTNSNFENLTAYNNSFVGVYLSGCLGNNFKNINSSVNSYNWSISRLDNSYKWSQRIEEETPEGYSKVYTCNDLQNVKNDLSGKYILMNDVDCSDTKKWNSGEGFEPIGISEELFELTGWIAGHGYHYVEKNSSKFMGTLDGNGHKIIGLNINMPSKDLVGLFSHIGSAGVVNNIVIVDSNIMGRSAVGTIAGFNSGQIFNSSVISSVSNLISNVSSLECVAGGLVGFNEGDIQSASFSGNVVSVYSVCLYGGLVGFHNGHILNSYSSGLVQASGWAVGGLVGMGNDVTADIRNSYSISNVIGGTSSDSEMVSGLVGWTYRTSIYNSFAVGNVSGKKKAGIATQWGGSTITNNYFNQYLGDSTNCFHNSYKSYDIGVCKILNNASYFMNSNNAPMNSWDFDNIWSISSTSNGGYPNHENSIIYPFDYISSFNITGGIVLFGSSNNNFNNVSVSLNNNDGFFVSQSSNNNFEDLKISGNNNGIVLSEVLNSNFNNVSVSLNNNDGIHLSAGSNNNFNYLITNGNGRVDGYDFIIKGDSSGAALSLKNSNLDTLVVEEGLGDIFLINSNIDKIDFLDSPTLLSNIKTNLVLSVTGYATSAPRRERMINVEQLYIMDNPTQKTEEDLMVYQFGKLIKSRYVIPSPPLDLTFRSVTISDSLGDRIQAHIEYRFSVPLSQWRNDLYYTFSFSDDCGNGEVQLPNRENINEECDAGGGPGKTNDWPNFGFSNCNIPGSDYECRCAEPFMPSGGACVPCEDERKEYNSAKGKCVCKFPFDENEDGNCDSDNCREILPTEDPCRYTCVFSDSFSEDFYLKPGTFLLDKKVLCVSASQHNKIVSGINNIVNKLDKMGLV